VYPECQTTTASTSRGAEAPLLSSHQADAYFSYITSPFLIDPWKYGGLTVRVSARASGPTTNPWAAEIQITVPVPTSGVPVLSVKPDRRHVYATLPGTTSYVFVVKSSGLADAYFQNVTPPFVIDAGTYGGRSVRVSARAAGPVTNPWAPEIPLAVPSVKLFGIDDANGPQQTSGDDAKNLGITLDRIEFDYDDSVASMDAKVALDTSHGLTPLPLLSQYGTISQFDPVGWQRWASSVVGRYGPGGSFWQDHTGSQFAPTYFEVLNEPYGAWFYPDPEPAAYATFFKVVASAAKAANPNVKLLLAAYPHTFQDSSGTSSTQSWDALLSASPDGPAALALADAVTTHPYGSYTSDQGWPTAVDVHQDFPSLPVWITEVGYRIGETVDGTVVTDEIQASWMQRSLVDYMGWPWAQAYLWFKWEDYGADNIWGVVRSDGTHRASYYVYQAFIS